MAKSGRQVLFTAGPLETSDTVKRTMLIDYGSRDKPFMEAIRYIREKAVSLAGVSAKEWVCILQPGAGTMGIEAAISTVTPREGCKYLLINSGKYSERQGEIVKRLGIPMVMLTLGEGEEVDFGALETVLCENPDITTVGYVHHETSTGMVYPAEQIAATVRRAIPSATIIADCMSSFGGIHFDVANSCDIFITSANKCFHSVPGVSVVIARRALIEKCKGVSRSSTLDLFAQLKSFDKSGQFSITPPVQPIMALKQSLIEYEEEGGLAGRQRSYAAKSLLVCSEAKKMGFTLFMKENSPGFAHIVVCLNMPNDPRWNFKVFYTYLSNHGFVIYPGKASHAETFRIGLMGNTTLEQTSELMKCCREALRSMGIDRLESPSKL